MDLYSRASMDQCTQTPFPGSELLDPNPFVPSPIKPKDTPGVCDKRALPLGRGKERAVVQSLKPSVAPSVLLDISSDAVPRGVLMLQKGGSRVSFFECVDDCRRQCVRHRGWSIHVVWHHRRRTSRDDVAADDGAHWSRRRGSRRRPWQRRR